MSKQNALVSFVCGLALVLAVASTNAQILIDDFNDGDADGWTPFITGDGESWGPGTFDASTGQYNLKTTGEVEIGTFPSIASSWDNSDDSMYSNGYVRATIREEAGGTNLGLVMRITNDTAAGYFFTTAYNPRSIQIGGCAALQDCTVYSQALVEFTAEDDWILEAGAVDDLLTAKVWRASDSEPEQPQLSVRNSDMSTGRIGVVTFHSASWPASSQTSGSFDDIYFTPVPEPSFVVVLLSALIGCLSFRRQGTAVAP